jgi:hypothetical protein
MTKRREPPENAPRGERFALLCLQKHPLKIIRLLIFIHALKRLNIARSQRKLSIGTNGTHKRRRHSIIAVARIGALKI